MARKISTDQLDASTSASANTVVQRDASGNVAGNQLISSVSTGTAPFTVSSTTKVTNLNVDLLDGAGVNDAAAASTNVLWTSDKISTDFQDKISGDAGDVAVIASGGGIESLGSAPGDAAWNANLLQGQTLASPVAGNDLHTLVYNNTGSSFDYKLVNTKYVVGSTSPFTTIQSAIDAADTDISAATGEHAVVLILPGNYTENLTLKQNVHLVGISYPSVLVTGSVTQSFTSGTSTSNNCSLFNLRITNTSGSVITFGGTAVQSLRIFRCTLTGSGAINISDSNSNAASSIEIEDAELNGSLAALKISKSGLGTIFGNTFRVGTLGTTGTASVISSSAGKVDIKNGFIYGGTALTGTAELIGHNVEMNSSGLTTFDTDSSVASQLLNCTMDTSSTTYAIDGTGEVQYGDISFKNVSAVNVTTYTPFTSDINIKYTKSGWTGITSVSGALDSLKDNTLDKDGSVGLNADWNAGSFKITAQTFQAGDNSSIAGSLIIGDGSAYTTTFQPSGAQTQNNVFTLPVDDGTNGQVLGTNGSGVLSWVTASGGGSNASDITNDAAEITGTNVDDALDNLITRVEYFVYTSAMDTAGDTFFTLAFEPVIPGEVQAQIIDGLTLVNADATGVSGGVLTALGGVADFRMDLSVSNEKNLYFMNDGGAGISGLGSTAPSVGSVFKVVYQAKKNA